MGHPVSTDSRRRAPAAAGLIGALAAAVAVLGGAGAAVAGGDGRDGSRSWGGPRAGSHFDAPSGPGRVHHGAGSFARRFERADVSAGAMFRWWWPGAAVDADELVAEIDAIADAGYKGVEIADVMMSVDYPVDPDKHGYGTGRWIQAVKTALEAADRRGLQVDLTLGAHWPAAVPGLDVNGHASSKELTYGYELVRDGAQFSGELPAPAPRAYEDRTSDDGAISAEIMTSAPEYVAASAVRCLADPCSGKPLEVDLGSQIDLTAAVTGDGTLEWTPPDAGTWVLMGHWYRGTAQRNDAPFANLPYLLTDPEARVVDHFSRDGTRAFIDYFEGLLDRETRTLLRRTRGSLFEDSLELKHSQAWTPEFLAQFEQRRGYSLLRYLPVLAKDASADPFGSSIPAFGFERPDAAVAARVMRDVEQTLGDLYLERHVAPIRRWAHSLGLDYRAQPYGEPIDLAQAAAMVDIAESESLACGSCDDWRMLASGSDMAGHEIVSDEMLPGGFGGSYRVTGQEVVRQANDEYSLGANQMVLHGFPYATWPESADGTISDGYARWPGFHAFPSFIPEPFGPRQPAWTMARDTSGYHTRTQLVLQAGRRQTDVAVYNQSLGHISSPYSDAGLLDAGYSYGYVTPGSLALPSARVAGRRLAPGGPAFKALIIDAQASMPLPAAQRIRAFARAGLPVVVVGAPPSTTPGYAATAAAAAAEDTALQEVIGELLDERTVHPVAAAADVPAALAAVGVMPAASATASAVRTVHRVQGNADYYYLHNASDEAVRASVSLAAERRGVPYELDPWTGSIAPIATYAAEGGRIRMEISFAPSEAMLIAIRPSRRAADVHVTGTTADSAVAVDGELAIRARSDGRYTTTLSDGRTVKTTIAGLPEPVDLARWELAVDEYRPGSAGDPSSHTEHVHWRFDDVALAPWSEIPEITDAVGVGTYTTAVRLPRRWTQRNGAYLALGALHGSFRVRVNGRSVGVVDQLADEVDIGPHLRAGTNRIEVEVATTMINRLRVFRPADYGSQAKQDYGLIGSVTLTPYREVAIDGRGGGRCHRHGEGDDRHDGGRRCD